MGGWKFLMWSFSSTSFIFWATYSKFFLNFSCFCVFLVVISALQSVKRSSKSSPASKSILRRALSEASSEIRAIGREDSFTIFWTYFMSLPKGSFSRWKRVFTILEPKNSCPWKVHPVPFTNFLVGAFPLSCSRAAQRSQRFSVFWEMLSTTSKVCQKLSLCVCPSTSSMPSNAVSSGMMSSSSPVSFRIFSPVEGFSESIILLNSTIIRSMVTIFILWASFLMASSEFSSIENPNVAANLTALIILSGSSE